MLPRGKQGGARRVRARAVRRYHARQCTGVPYTYQPNNDAAQGLKPRAKTFANIGFYLCTTPLVRTDGVVQW